MNENQKINLIDNIILEEENKRLKKENKLLKEKVENLINIIKEVKENG